MKTTNSFEVKQSTNKRKHLAFWVGFTVMSVANAQTEPFNPSGAQEPRQELKGFEPEIHRIGVVPEAPILAIPKAVNFSWCASSATACAFSSAGFALTCGADAAATISAIFFPPAAGTVPALTAGCIATFAGVGTACSSAMGICIPGSGTYTPPQRNLRELYGSDFSHSGIKAVDLACGGNHRVRALQIEHSGAPGTTGGYVRRIQMTCTNGTVLTAGHSKAGGTSESYSCATGDLMNGLRIREDQWLDSLGAVCRQVGLTTASTPTSHPNIYGPEMGGTGGSFTNFGCGHGKYLHGFKAEWHETTIPYIHWIRPYCL